MRRVAELPVCVVVDSRLAGEVCAGGRTMGETKRIAYLKLATELMCNRGYVKPFSLFDYSAKVCLRLARYLQWLDEKGY